MMYQFFKKRNKTDSDAYMNSILLYFFYIIIYTFFLISQSLSFVLIIVNKISDILMMPKDISCKSEASTSIKTFTISCSS